MRHMVYWMQCNRLWRKLARLSYLWFWLGLAFGGSLELPVFGVERFPPPEFEPGYVMPATTVPAPRATWHEFVDVGVLLAALSVAAYFSLVKRSRRYLFGLAVFSLAYFGFYRQGCVCAIGSIQDVTLALFNHGYAVPVTVLAFFLLPLLFTLFFGRGFCGGVCPLGAIQDLVLVKPVKVPAWLEHGLGVIPFIYLGLAVLLAATGSAFIICEYDPFVSFFRRSGSITMLSLGALFLIAGLFFGRPYCRVFCPYGALLRLVSTFSKWNVTLTPNDCIRCQICDVACPYGAIDEPGETATVPPPAKYGKLAGLVALAPLLVLIGGSLGGQLGVPLSRMHPTVQLAEQIMTENSGKALPPTDASKGFRQSGKSADDLVAAALQIREQTTWGGWIMGGFIGLVFGLKLIFVDFPARHTVYEPNRSNCVACGRCFTYCPKELSRVKKVQRPNTIPLKAA